MRVQSLDIPDVKLITLERLHDERGFFSETYSKERFAALGIEADFVQDNYSVSEAAGVVRGLHYQISPQAQGKLVRVGRGAVFDVAVDIRPGSPTYGHHVATVLSAESWAQVWIPVGFAHGFCTLEPDTEVLYKTTAHYAPQYSRGIRWDDPALGIAWPVDSQKAILSRADRAYPHFEDLRAALEASAS